MYVFGGYNGRDDKHFNDVYRFNEAKATWSLLNVHGRGPRPRRRQCCIMIRDKLYLFGGTSPIRNDVRCNTDDPLWPERNLVDHSDLYVLDMNPTLKSLSMICVVNSAALRGEIGKLPKSLR
ncbi:unnamed protein product [Soboliphyme baturini]|uniref:Kelch domain-containing protein 10 n=1 Tax=Soboliphyme baturini TaxID=241478 RepID=A0A183IMS0_9BILA|nr:unnamed protein product [Soboliphyme baturini]